MSELELNLFEVCVRERRLAEEEARP